VKSYDQLHLISQQLSKIFIDVKSGQSIDFIVGVQNMGLIFAPKSIAYRQENFLIYYQ